MTSRLISVTNLIAASAVIAMLASCGGSGGGSSGSGGPVATLALIPANAQTVAGKATHASLDAPDRASNLGLLSVQPGSGSTLPSHNLSRALAQAVAALGHPQRAQFAPLATTTTTMPCAVSGSIDTLVNGSTAVVTFNACSSVAGESISGTFTFSNFTSTSNGGGGTTSADLTFSFTGFPDQHFTGTFSFSVAIVGTVTTITLSGSELVLDDGTDTERLASFTLVVTEDTGATGDTVTFNFSSTVLGGSVNVTTLVPFQTTPGRSFPHAGSILISGTMGSAIKVTVLGDETAPAPQVRIELDADGNGVFETVIEKNWSDLHS